MHSRERLGLLLAGLLVAAWPAWSQQGAPARITPKVTNAKLETHAVQGSLEREFRALVEQQAAPAWIGYAVPQVAGDRTVCCGNSWAGKGGGVRRCDACRLEHGDDGVNVTNVGEKTVRLEGPQELFVLFRAEAKRVEKIRVASEDCELDAGGLRFVWLTSVKPAESVALLSGYAAAGDSDAGAKEDVAQGALMAVALHGDASADRALEAFVAKERPESLRKHATFWLGEARGKAGVAILKRMAQSDPSDEVRAQVTFALSVSREPEALDEMIRMAKSDSSGHVRGQALFWLAQKAGKKAAGAISEAIENDPNTEVKKKAVFALSQMPKEEGVPKLIEVARTNKNPAVRKQAIFWLGQSNDPRALKFFEEVLMH